MMKAFKKRGALTHFQILSEISKQDPHLKQKDLANKLGITIQAVSENIKTLIEQGYISSKDGRSPYKITQKGIEKVKKDAISLRKYSDAVLETMNHYKTIWPAIAREDLQKDDIVGLFMDDGVLYAHKKEENATGIVMDNTKEGMDVALSNLTGTIDVSNGEVTIINVPTIKDGGSKASDLELIKKVYENGTNSGEPIDKIACAGTVSRAIINKLELPLDIEYAAPNATANAARKGLNVLAICVGDMSKAFTRELESEKIKYNVIDGKK
ncbi:putative transcriptional regulator [Methanobrevibacter gottschalkii DSM 11977]|uniref:Putative transcriptional regulator n=2 Tax=Methanobacteriaceae TaxID=2159 RepID=A0A3N5B358_9EURY|nr:putative transcriptional regulator [Methanobrevibacter gottschalkii DSM 11977]